MSNRHQARRTDRVDADASLADATIGEAAKASGVSAKMIRYYEDIGLLGRIERLENNYRRYSQADIHKLQFVRRCRELGFSMAQTERLVALWRDRDRASAEVKQIATDHIRELEAKIEALESMRRTLAHLADHCHGDDRPDCPILEDLAEGAKGRGD